MPPILIAMCGLPFSGKSVLASALSRELGIRVLSYDSDIYLAYQHLIPPGAPAAAGDGIMKGVARDKIGAILARGQSLIYDDLLLARDDRRRIAAVAQHYLAELVLVYLDTPLPVIEARRAENSRRRTRASIPEAEIRQGASRLEPPDAGQAIYVGPDDNLTGVLARIRNRLSRLGPS